MPRWFIISVIEGEPRWNLLGGARNQESPWCSMEAPKHALDGVDKTPGDT
jgi:hypothetical protein